MGAIALTSLSLLGIYVVGGILVWMAFVQTGGWVAFAAVYLALGVVAPVLAAVRVRRIRRSSVRAVVSIAAFISLAVSILFLPIATLPLGM